MVEGVGEFLVGLAIACVVYAATAPNLIACAPRSKAEVRAERAREIERARSRR